MSPNVICDGSCLRLKLPNVPDWNLRYEFRILTGNLEEARSPIVIMIKIMSNSTSANPAATAITMAMAFTIAPDASSPSNSSTQSADKVTRTSTSAISCTLSANTVPNPADIPMLLLCANAQLR